MICFFHIEKAAGTTLNYILRNNYLSFMVLPTLGSWTNKFENAFSLTDAKILTSLLPFTRGFGGHIVRPFLEYENDLADKIISTFMDKKHNEDIGKKAKLIAHHHFDYQIYILPVTEFVSSLTK